MSLLCVLKEQRLCPAEIVSGRMGGILEGNKGFAFVIHYMSCADSGREDISGRSPPCGVLGPMA